MRQKSDNYIDANGKSMLYSEITGEILPYYIYDKKIKSSEND